MKLQTQLEGWYILISGSRLVWKVTWMYLHPISALRGFTSKLVDIKRFNIQSKWNVSIMGTLQRVKPGRLTWSCLWWDCRAGCAEWFHPAACPSWRRSLQTCRPTGEKQGCQRSANCLEAHFHSFAPVTVKCTWFLSDMRKSSLDPGNPSSMKVFTRRRSALFPRSRWRNRHTKFVALLLLSMFDKHSKVNLKWVSGN